MCCTSKVLFIHSIMNFCLISPCHTFHFIHFVFRSWMTSLAKSMFSSKSHHIDAARGWSRRSSYYKPQKLATIYRRNKVAANFICRRLAIWFLQPIYKQINTYLFYFIFVRKCIMRWKFNAIIIHSYFSTWTHKMVWAISIALSANIAQCKHFNNVCVQSFPINFSSTFIVFHFTSFHNHPLASTILRFGKKIII